MKPEELLKTWAATLTALELVDAGDRDATARANMEVFSIAAVQDAGVAAPVVADFVRNAHRAYSLAATRIGRSGWFYAWHDELAGQLRTSACWIASQHELPFRGPITLVDDPESLATALLSSQIAHGIPWSELIEPPPNDSMVEPAPPATLVYARPLISSS